MEEKQYKSKAFEMQQLVCYLQQQVQLKQKQLTDLTRLSLQYSGTNANANPSIATQPNTIQPVVLPTSASTSTTTTVDVPPREILMYEINL